MSGASGDPGSPRVDSVADLYGQALAIEIEASERYAELADQMDVHNNREVADLFRKMAAIEAKHADEIRQRAGAALAGKSGMRHHWTGFQGPETADYADAHYLMTPYHALDIALENERRAAAYFAEVAAHAADDRIRELAARLAEEEREHVELVRNWLAKFPKPAADWADDPDPPVYSE